MIFAQKADEVAQLDLIIAFVSARPEFDFLDLDLLQLELRFVLLLRFAILELAVVHDADHRRLRRGRDLDQIEFRGLSARRCICERDDTELLTLFTYQPDLGRIDLAVDARCFFLGYVKSPKL